MTRNQGSESDELLEQILTDAYGDDEQLWALRQALEENVAVPCAATIAGEPVTVTKFDYDGNARRGLTATIRQPNGARHAVAAADIVLADTDTHRYIAAYRTWMGVAPPARKPKPARATEPVVKIDAVVLSLAGRIATCKILNGGETIAVRAGKCRHVVPGEIATVKPARHKTARGTIESTRLDAKALGLTPLRLRPEGNWDPAEHYWGEPGGPVEPWARKMMKRGRRPVFEMEQVVPGDNPADPWSDPILQSNDKKDVGDVLGAREILMELCRADLRCLDAHAHLGNLSFDMRPIDSIRHYEVGVRIGELSLPEGFSGVLPWGMIDNRPFLRCLQGFGLCLWRLKQFDESVKVFDRMLWLNPSDNQGARFLIDDAREHRAWTPDL